MAVTMDFFLNKTMRQFKIRCLIVAQYFLTNRKPKDFFILCDNVSDIFIDISGLRLDIEKQAGICTEESIEEILINLKELLEKSQKKWESRRDIEGLSS